MASPHFIDANIIILYYVGPNDSSSANRRKAEQAKALFDRVEQGLETIHIPLPVLYEAIFTMQRRFGQSKSDIHARLIDLLASPDVRMTNKRLFLQALDLYATAGLGLSIVDAMVVVEMYQRKASKLYSWDTDFDGLPKITRVAP